MKPGAMKPVGALDKRKAQADGAPQRRYEDVKAASASAADRIAKATEELLGTFRQVYEPEYDRPRETALKLIDATESPP
jgi:hypothetical protein